MKLSSLDNMENLNDEPTYMIRKLVEFTNISLQSNVNCPSLNDNVSLTSIVPETIARILSRELELTGYDNLRNNIIGRFINEPMGISREWTGQVTCSDWNRVHNEVVEINGSFRFSLKKSVYNQPGMEYFLDIECLDAVIVL